MEKLLDLMMGGVLTTKYFDPRRQFISMKINNKLISNMLIHLGYVVNVMKRKIMKSLGHTDLRGTTKVLQLTDRSTIKLEGTLEDVVIFWDSWEYHIDFIILQPKTYKGGYPLIWEWPWLAIADAYISCQWWNMTIFYGTSTKKLTLYHPSIPNIDIETPLWIDVEKSDEEGEA